MTPFRYKFVKKIEYTDPILGRTACRLINLLPGDDITPYENFVIGRIRMGNSPASSVKSWADDLGNFFNYFVAASEFAASNTNKFSACPLSDIIFLYPRYLSDASTATDLIAKHLAELILQVSRAASGLLH